MQTHVDICRYMKIYANMQIHVYTVIYTYLNTATQHLLTHYYSNVDYERRAKKVEVFLTLKYQQSTNRSNL